MQGYQVPQYLLLLYLCHVVASGLSGVVSEQNNQLSSVRVRQAALLSASCVSQLQMAGRQREQRRRFADLGVQLAVQLQYKVVPLALPTEQRQWSYMLSCDSGHSTATG